MLNKVIMRENEYLKKFNYLLRYKGTVGIYGAGVFGKKLGDMLFTAGIVPDYYVVDSQYYTENSRMVLVHNGSVTEVPIITTEFFNSLQDDKVIISGIEIRHYEYDTKILMIRKKFNYCELIDFDHPYYFTMPMLDYNFFLSNHERFIETYNMLSDSFSKYLFVSYINACISGDAQDLYVGAENDYLLNEYDYDLLLKEKDGIIIESGAFDGKTFLQIDNIVKGKQQIYALEPDPENYKLLCSNLSGRDNLHAICVGTSDYDGKAFFRTDDSSCLSSIAKTKSDSDTYEVDIAKLDTILGKEKVSAIIMDIEGSELSTLKGSRDIIANCKPSLGIRVYHKKEDLITIPQYLKSVRNDYKFYIRYNSFYRGTHDTTLYAI